MSYLDEYFLFLKTEKKLGDSTILSYKLDLNSFDNFISKDFISITKDDIVGYLSYLRDTISVRSINRHISSLKGFYNFLLEEGYIKESPLENISVMKTEKKLPAQQQQLLHQ